MRWCVVVMAICLPCAAGCGGKPGPVRVSGIVKTASGQAVTGVAVFLEPESTMQAWPLLIPLDNEGHFEGQVIPGSYTFSLKPVEVLADDDAVPINEEEAKKAEKSREALNAYPAGYQTSKGAGPNRIVKLTSGAKVELVVNN